MKIVYAMHLTVQKRVETLFYRITVQVFMAVHALLF